MLNLKRPMYMEQKPKGAIKAERGINMRCKSWELEAALRMLENNLDPEVAIEPEQLIVYGGSGRAARNWDCYNKIVHSLKTMCEDESLLIQSGKAVGIIRSFQHSPRILIANSNLVPAWADLENFEQYDKLGLTMYGQMTAGSWIYIATQGIIQGTYETFAEVAKQHFNGTLEGTLTLTAGLGGMGGAQPHAVTMNGGVVIIVECRQDRIERKVKEGYCDIMASNLRHAIDLAVEAKIKKQPLSIGLLGNAATIFMEFANNNEVMPDIVTDQTSAHNLLDYIPEGDVHRNLDLLNNDPNEYKKASLASIVKHCQAMLLLQNKGAIVFDYGNNLRKQAELGGLKVRDAGGKMLYPGFVPAYIRNLFCRGEGPFRWVALSGDVEDIIKIDLKMRELFPYNNRLNRWLDLAQEKVPQLGLPARICWLGYGDRAKAGVAINNMVRNKELKAPIVIGRDHLDCGSVASPYRETEDMLDKSDAIADWPLLNALINTACGADWVSIHSGGGVGIGYSIHAGMVVVATGTKEKEERLIRVLNSDPTLGVIRHADAGYQLACDVAKMKNIKIPHLVDL